MPPLNPPLVVAKTPFVSTVMEVMGASQAELRDRVLTKFGCRPDGARLSRQRYVIPPDL